MTPNSRPAVHPKGPGAPMPANAFQDDDTDKLQAIYDAAAEAVFVFKVATITVHHDRVG